MAIDPELFAQALADLRGITTTPRPEPEPVAQPEPRPTRQPDCCTGDRRGYQSHQRTGTPACDESREAAAAYSRDYYGRTGRWDGRTRRHRAADAKNAA